MKYSDKQYIAKLIREETGCGMYEASVCFDALLKSIRCRPNVHMDNPSYIQITWKRASEMDDETDSCDNCPFNDTSSCTNCE